MLLPPGGVEADREGLLTFDEQFCPRRCDAGLVSCLAHVLCFVLQSDPVDSEAAVAVGVLDQSVIGACHFRTNLIPRHFWFRMAGYITLQLNWKCLINFFVVKFSCEPWRLWHFDWKQQKLVI
ncbi:hypothetical protein NP493_191g02002 [Ridgeia piscesae]|uniref:Uncharacterized protein n=1 Tax=Ridgeia piscesae TaxID=27915 RepID=A0AAD9P226_RIDPI|nr:hypothetical protein NP493_191g02002 [Ridgeia piscesae]